MTQVPDPYQKSNKLLDVERTRVVHTYRKELTSLAPGSSPATAPQATSKGKGKRRSSSDSIKSGLLRAGHWLRVYLITVVGALSCVVGGYLLIVDYNRSSIEEQFVVSPEIEPLISRYQDLDDYFGGEPLALAATGTGRTDTASAQEGGPIKQDSAPRVSFTGVRSREGSATSATVKRMMIRLITQKVYDVVKRYPEKMDPVEMTSLIMSESLKAGFDPLLVTAVVKIESAFNPKAKSHVGARGLMQIMPGTKTFIEKMEKVAKADRKSLNTPDYNLRLGIAYLKYLIKKYNGNRGYALMAYNWGPGHLTRALKRSSKAKVPASVQRYAVKILDSHSVWNSQLTTTLLFEEY